MSISISQLQDFKEKYEQNVSARTIANSIIKNGIEKATINYKLAIENPDVYSDTVKGGSITNQKQSGRCWMFASLNAMRTDTFKLLNVEDFEFSESYPFFWDKLEKSNYFLNSIIKTKSERTDSRIVQHILANPLQDGGQWDMFKGLLEKYGAVPKEIMPETFHSSKSNILNGFLTSKLREFAYEIREGKEDKNLNDYLYEIYHILCLSLGTPPNIFDYEYLDKDKKYRKIKNISPQEFFKKYVNWNLEDKISLINAPTSDKPYGRVYTVKFLGTVLEADPIRYINVPIDVLKKAAISQIKEGSPVWFGCDVKKRLDFENGIMDMNAYDYKGALNTSLNLNKAQRLDYGDSLLTHAMVFTGVNLDEEGKATRWQVENSWGSENAVRKGYYTMSDEWFEEYNYQIMVDRKYIPEEYLKALDDEMIELEPWDPMGALALVK